MKGSDQAQRQAFKSADSKENPAGSEPVAPAAGEAMRGSRIFREDERDLKKAVRAAANRELSSDLLETGVERLAGISRVAAAIFAASAGAVALLRSDSGPAWTSALAILCTALVLTLMLNGVTRLQRISAQAVADLGYLYLVLVCVLIAALRYLAGPSTHVSIASVSPAVVPILCFGALVPVAPKKGLVISLIAAAMDPLVLATIGPRELPAAQLVLLVSSPFVAALLAFGLSRVTHRLREGIVKALEVGSYRLVERLGVGGMAEVWSADHRMLARPAAVKLIRQQVLNEHGPVDAERLLRLFAREARTTASLKSPHTVEIYDFGITREGAFYQVMELLDGVDLQRLVERYGPQPEERVAYLLRQACHSLEEAHARAFVHRDVKPANIFTCHYGEDFDFVKLLDFGLVLDRHPTQEELEDEKRFVGTPAVMAPEMVRYQAPVDARADLYALGCVGYWLLAGKRVFEATTRHDMLVMHAHQKPLTPSRRLGKPLHAGLEAVIMSCLEKSPNRRPQSAREISDAIAALEFERPWTGERARLWWRAQGLAERKSEPVQPAGQGGAVVGDGEAPAEPAAEPADPAEAASIAASQP